MQQGQCQDSRSKQTYGLLSDYRKDERGHKACVSIIVSDAITIPPAHTPRVGQIHEHTYSHRQIVWRWSTASTEQMASAYMTAGLDDLPQDAPPQQSKEEEG